MLEFSVKKYKTYPYNLTHVTCRQSHVFLRELNILNSDSTCSNFTWQCPGR